MTVAVLRDMMQTVRRKYPLHHVLSLCRYDPEQFAGTHIPILVVGTKLDLAQTVRDQVIHKPSSIAEECGADEFNMVCQLC